jgi:hypothetical protein
VTHDSITQETGPRLLGKAFNHDQDQAVPSLELLRHVPAEVLLPGHGEPFRGAPGEAIDQAIGRL